MTNKISLLNPGLWHERAVNHMDQCAKAKGSARPFKQVAANTLAMGTGAIAGVSQVAKFVFAQPVGMALTAVIGLVRVLTWSDCLSSVYRALPGPMDWLRTAGKIVAYTISLPVSALAAAGSLLGSKSSHLNVRYQKKFICTPLQKKTPKPAPRPPAPPKAKQPLPDMPAAPLPLAQPPIPLQPPQQLPNPPAALPVPPQVPVLPAPLAQPVVVTVPNLPVPIPQPVVVTVPVLPAPLPFVPALSVPAVAQPAANPPPAVAPAVPNVPAAPVAVTQPEILPIERAAALVPPAIGLYIAAKTLSYGAALTKSVVGGAFSLLSSAVTKVIPTGVQNATLQTVTQSSVLTPLAINVTTAAAPYLARAALWALKGTAQQVVQNQCPVAAPFLNGTLACIP